MKSFNQLKNIVGWVVFAIATLVYAFSAEPTGSLWDCGEFIAGAYKLQVVHPPGAPLFILIGRMFTMVAETIFPDDPAKIAYAVNLMSGVCTAFAAAFTAWSMMILGKLTLVGREGELTTGQGISILGGGLVAGLATTFASSVWFSAVEGEVYAMSFFFTTLTFWSMLKWYNLPDTKAADRWIIFAAYMVGLSIGVHLLSLLTIPAIALLYYFKKFKNINLRGGIVAIAIGVFILVLIQAIMILNLPKIGAAFDLVFVNTFGLPYGSGLMFFVLLLIGGLVFGLYYTHKRVTPISIFGWLQIPPHILQKAIMGLTVVLIGFSTYGTILIRANANTPINMNNPSDVFSFVSYLNREQYGDRPLVRGPHYAAGRPIKYDSEDRYGPVDGRYEVVDEKITPVYNPADMMFFPRRGHLEPNKADPHKAWTEYLRGSKTAKPNQVDNIRYFVQYQMGWMYWRYFMWNFVGRQNGDQGYFPWDPKSGHWMSGIQPVDNARLYNQNELPEAMKQHQARNFYYFLPLIFGLFGLYFFARNNRNDFIATAMLFLMTGLAIIVYSNQPPNEPRERDYVLVGSFMVYCMWMGFAVPALWQLFKERLGLNGTVSAIAATALVITAPLVMGFQNWDDHSRGSHYGARDYAINFLESCEKDAIIFTHGDNDTYPLWYAQEVEGIRTDVRVINLSLLAVDWYIDQLRRKINESPAIQMSIPPSAYRGNKRNQLLYSNQDALPAGSTIQSVVKFMGEEHPLPLQNGRQTESYLPTKTITIPVDPQKVLQNGTVNPSDTGRVLDRITFTINKNSLIKDETAILDIIASNNWERPIYFAVTCRPNKLLGLQDYVQLEGMAMRLVPVKTTSDRSLGFIGSGRIDVDKTYNNIMTKFKWGNFDKERLFVDRSYAPSVMSMRLVFVRLARELSARGEKEKAAEVLNKYFEAYPHMNFPYDFNTMFVVAEYYRGKNAEAAKPHVKKLAEELVDYMDFYMSLSSDDLAAFNQEYQQTQSAINRLNTMVADNDEAFKTEVQAILKDYVQQQPQQPTLD